MEESSQQISERPDGSNKSSVDVLAAQVRQAIYSDPSASVRRESLAALDVLVGYAKRAEELEATVAVPTGVREALAIWQDYKRRESEAMLKIVRALERAEGIERGGWRNDL